MNTPQHLPRHMLVTLALLGGTIGLTAGSSYAAAPTSPAAPTQAEVAPAETEVAPTETDVAVTDSHGCGEGEILSDAEFAADFEGFSDAERSALVEQMEADAATLTAELDAKGIEYTTEVDPVTGVEWPSVDYDDAAAIEVFDSQVFEYVITEDDDVFAADFGALDDAQRSALVEQMTADAAAFKAQLDAAGVSYTTELDPITGVEFPTPDDTEAVDGLDLPEFAYSF